MSCKNKTVRQKVFKRALATTTLKTRQQHHHHLNDPQESPCLLTLGIWWSLQKRKNQTEHTNTERKGKLETKINS